MEKLELTNLLEKIKTQKAEQQNVEIKAAHGGAPEKFYDSVSSFANRDEGGVIIFGVSESNNYDIVGVYDANDLQKKVVGVCENMTPVIRPSISVHEFSGKVVLVVEIPPVDYELRPAYYTPKGKINGSYVRVGDADDPMTASEIYTYDAYRGRVRDDIRVPFESSWKLLNETRLSEYLFEVKKARENLSRNVSDAEILELMGVTKNGQPTLAGIMVFSSYPQSFFPNLTINAVVVPGKAIGDVGMSGERFISNKKITGSQEVKDYKKGEATYDPNSISSIANMLGGKKE